MKIGFFGVGHMGGPMAANLVKAGQASRLPRVPLKRCRERM